MTRKERRANANNAAATTTINNPQLDIDIPLAQPDRSGPQGKTLYELAEERQKLLRNGQPFEKKPSVSSSSSSQNALPKTKLMRMGPTGELEDAEDPLPSSEAQNDDEETPLSPIINSLFHTLTLSSIHFTLDVLVHHQYAELLSWSTIWTRTLTAVPLLFLLVYVLSAPLSQRVFMQVALLGVAVACGCSLVTITNTQGYYAVMKRAPPMGTLWVWSVIELRLPFAVGSLVGPVFWLWWKNYSFL